MYSQTMLPPSFAARRRFPQIPGKHVGRKHPLDSAASAVLCCLADGVPCSFTESLTKTKTKMYYRYSVSNIVCNHIRMKSSRTFANNPKRRCPHFLARHWLARRSCFLNLLCTEAHLNHKFFVAFSQVPRNKDA